MEDDNAGDGGRENSGKEDTRLTFAALMMEGRRRGAQDGTPATAMASNEAALRSLARAYGHTDKESFTGLLGVQGDAFDLTLQAYEGKTTVSNTTITAYRSRLRTWNLIAGALVREHAPDPGLFGEVLGDALASFLDSNASVTKTSVAAQAGMTLKGIWAWTKPGRMRPVATPLNMARAARLEEALRMPAGSLTSKLVPQQRKGKPFRTLSQDRAARNDVVPLNIIRFRPEHLSGEVAVFFDRLVTWKTTPNVLRNAGGSSIKKSGKTWRVVPKSDDPIPSANITEARFRTLTGWMSLPDTVEGAREHVLANCPPKMALDPFAVSALAPLFMGKGIPLEEITPAHLVDPDLIAEYIGWHKKRYGSVTDRSVQSAITQLVPKKGFLAQQVECAWGYDKVGIQPVDMAEPGARQAYLAASEEWTAKCATWTTELKELLPFTTVGRTHTARDRLKPILDQRDLIGVVNTIIENHAADRPVGKLVSGWSGSVTLALWVRDQLLLRMLASNPLRNRNFREMRYLDNPTQRDRGNLHRGVDGGWKLLFQPDDFKNERGAAKETYDVAVPEILHPVIDLYLTEARPILMRSGVKTDRVFITMGGHPFTVDTLSRAVIDLTGRYVQDDIDTLGFRTHAFRHIIATAWLRAHPKDYLTVAHILHDNLQTVLDNYGHDKPNDGLELYNQWLSTKMSPLQLPMAA